MADARSFLLSMLRVPRCAGLGADWPPVITVYKLTPQKMVLSQYAEVLKVSPKMRFSVTDMHPAGKVTFVLTPLCTLRLSPCSQVAEQGWHLAPHVAHACQLDAEGLHPPRLCRWW